MADNLAIWKALEKTDPAHTKPFNRPGGFKGTAVKPIWIVKKLTEQFGPCGIGWGTNEPTFQVVPCDGEILVFCTVSGWHGDRANTVFGVGGDKVQAKRGNGVFCDDEAFKKAHTDAIGNAFKLLGIAADVHMGQFDDDKYVAQARADSEGSREPNASLQIAIDAIGKCETQHALKQWWDQHGDTFSGADAEKVVEAINKRKEQIKTMDRIAA